jgi:AcrR family transcriptional regulator
MSTETRKYEKRLRARKEAETRRRITEAAVELHGTVGPARTSLSAVAERAGVQRATLYRHFPNEEALFEACSTHYMSQNPPPDPTPWRGIADPDERLQAALDSLYSWYERVEPMFNNVTRDVALVPAMRGATERRLAFLSTVREILMRGRQERGAARRRVRAAIGHALAFETWRSLASEQGLSRRAAVELMLAMVAASGSRPTASRWSGAASPPGRGHRDSRVVREKHRIGA